MGLDKNNPEIFENTIASLVDTASILFAYQIGVAGFGLGVGVLYAMFDAFIVIWMRKPISRFARAISPYRFQQKVRPKPESVEQEVRELGGDRPAVKVTSAAASTDMLVES